MRLFDRKPKIEVTFQNGESGEVSPYLLNTCIETGQIIQFKRSAGWVRIGQDPIRGTDGNYKGVERRKNGSRGFGFRT